MIEKSTKLDGTTIEKRIIQKHPKNAGIELAIDQIIQKYAND